MEPVFSLFSVCYTNFTRLDSDVGDLCNGYSLSPEIKQIKYSASTNQIALDFCYTDTVYHRLHCTADGIAFYYFEGAKCTTIWGK